MCARTAAATLPTAIGFGALAAAAGLIIVGCCCCGCAGVVAEVRGDTLAPVLSEARGELPATL